MAVQQTFIGRAKCITGTVLVGVGIFVSYKNLHQAATQFNLGVNAGEAPGLLPTAILAVYRVLQTYGSDHARLVQACFLYVLASTWPLLLVMAGTVLSRGGSRDNVNALPEKKIGTCRSDCWLFDVR